MPPWYPSKGWPQAGEVARRERERAKEIKRGTPQEIYKERATERERQIESERESETERERAREGRRGREGVSERERERKREREKERERQRERGTSAVGRSDTSLPPTCIPTLSLSAPLFANLGFTVQGLVFQDAGSGFKV